MKFWLIAFLFLLPVVAASNVEVRVAEYLKGEFVLTNYTLNDNILNATTEFYNSGSVSYRLRMRLDVYDGVNRSVWSDERTLLPGSREHYTIFWPVRNNNITARFRAYFANEIMPEKSAALAAPQQNRSDVFEIANIKTSGSRIEFDVTSNKSADIMAVAVSYPTAWIFEESGMHHVENNSIVRVGMNYKADIWSPASITVAIFSYDGKYYTEKKVKLEPENAEQESFAGIFWLILKIFVF